MTSQRPRRGEGPALGLGSSSDVNVSLNWQGPSLQSGNSPRRVPSRPENTDASWSQANAGVGPVER